MNSNEAEKYSNYEIFLGRSIDDEEIIRLINGKEKTEMKEHTYVNFMDRGVSLYFKNKILNTIFFYNEGVQKFSRYNGTLPMNISWDHKNMQVVEYLGDTSAKAGGKTPIWLSYERLGIEITFLGSDWGDVDNPITHVSIFTPATGIKECSVCLKEVSNINKCDKCLYVAYCSTVCKNAHISFHNKYCK